MVSSALPRNVRTANNNTMRDEDVFILGDDEDDEDEAHEIASASLISEPAPPVYPLASSSSSSLTSESILTAQTSDASEGHGEVIVKGEQYIPSRYYINSRDTLQGIALRYRANVRYHVRIYGHH